jgi:hypothetical protein
MILQSGSVFIEILMCPPEADTTFFFRKTSELLLYENGYQCIELIIDDETEEEATVKTSASKYPVGGLVRLRPPLF